MNRTTRTSDVLYVRLIATVAILTSVGLASSTCASAQQIRILHSFRGNSTDGGNPFNATLVFDKAANLYGVTLYGGAFNYGTVFEVSPKTGGGWTEKTLHSFNDNGKDGYNAYGSLIFDASGNLYGTSANGGVNNLGTVFELIPQSGGTWNERILHSFAGPNGSGADPYGNLVFDSKGNLYGTAAFGGTGTKCGNYPGCGVVYELTPRDGVWKEKVLYSFGVSSTDGYFPLGGLVFDAVGNLYGVTEAGGVYNDGMVFELTPGAGGSWTEKDLHDLNGSALDGTSPEAGLVFDKAGNLYGTTVGGGAYNDGTVYELTPAGDGSWTETVICSFNAGVGYGGRSPYDALILDAAGDLYGTTSQGGPASGLLGTAFKLTPGAGGVWTQTVLINFDGTNGADPFGGLVFDGRGNLYGTTQGQGFYGQGEAFEIVR
jgi:uncharacterized repeat protein (TIGR03803 family)